MPKYPMKEIAFQAGVSLATVDRYLHNRPGLRSATKLRIKAAVAELDAQYAQTVLHQARLSIDIIMDAPDRFTAACRAAFLAELPALRPATLRCRFHFGSTWDDAAIIRLLQQIRKRGSHGVVLKTRAAPAIRQAVQALTLAGIPVLTFVTDLTGVDRLAYVGMNNQAAGQSAAWMMSRMLGPSSAVLLTLSGTDFLGEQARADGFKAQISPKTPVHVIAPTGSDHDIQTHVAQTLQDHPSINAVYSSGGANRAIQNAFASQARRLDVHAGHDLDATNIQLLKDQRLDFVIHHDLRQDARQVFQHVLKHHKMLHKDFEITPTQFSIVTPFSIGPAK